MSDSDSSSSDDSRFASPESTTPIITSAIPTRAPSPGPTLPAATTKRPSAAAPHARAAAAAAPPPPPAAIATLKPPTFAPAPETLPAERPPSIASEKVSSDALSKARTALESLSKILSSPIPGAVSNSPNPAVAALYDASVSHSISCLLRAPNSGSGDNPLCRWLYDTFQSNEPNLQLLVLRFAPLIAGVYLARAATQRRHLAGFEAVLLALYSHETASRASDPVTVTLPDLSSPSVYHETAPSSKAAKSEPTVAVVSAALEPHGTVRSTRRACIAGVALDLYYGKISLMPLASKVEFCEFCDVWSGHVEDPNVSSEAGGGGVVEERIPLPWELMQPTLRILGHCLVGPTRKDVLHGKARKTCKKLYARALHDVNPKAILIAESLLRMIKIEEDKEVDYTEIPDTRVISI